MKVPLRSIAFNFQKLGGVKGFSVFYGKKANALQIHGVKDIIAVASGKGGVGKSTTAAEKWLSMLQQRSRHQELYPLTPYLQKQIECFNITTVLNIPTNHNVRGGGGRMFGFKEKKATKTANIAATTSTDFLNHSFNPSQSPSSSPKAIYKIRYEKDRARKLAAHRRAVLRVESRIAEHSRRIQDLVAKKTDEKIKINDAFLQLSNLHKVRQASVAMNVWQPEIIRSRQRDMVEQCSVPVDSRINALEMEVKLCKQQMTVLDKAYRDEKNRLAATKEQLASLQYHPLRDISETSSLAGIHDSRNKRKKLKRCCSADDTL